MTEETTTEGPTPDQKRKYLASLRPDPALAAAFRTLPDVAPDDDDS